MFDTREAEGGEVDNRNSRISNDGHPLVNPVVASKIFEFVTLSELRTLRLVCKDWYSISLPIWRRRVQINIHDESSNQRLLQWKYLGTELDIAEEQPFRNIRLHWTQFLADISRPYISHRSNMNPMNFEGKYRNMEQFWENYGHWIHKLELKHVYVTDVEAFKRAIFEQTPNLQELTLERIIDGRNAEGRNPLPVQGNGDEGPALANLNLKAFAMKDSSKLPFGWRLFFPRFPNIQKLELSEPYKRSDADEMFECLENMLMSPARRPNLPITDLRLKVTLDGPSEKLLRNPLVKLKVLHLSLYGYSDNNFDILRTAMHHHGNTLEELHLQNDVEPIDFWKSVVGPYASLTELQMKGSNFAISFDFLNKLPNLKVLRLEQKYEERMLNGTNWSALETMPRLLEFYFIVTLSEESELVILYDEDLERFAKVMPNLECFTGQLNYETLRVVCRNWRQLKKLVLLSGRNFDLTDDFEDQFASMLVIDDVGITGIVPGTDERMPCVADLQELRHLTLEDVTLIGDASVYDGFLKLPHLSALDICEENKVCTFKISKEGLRYLKRRLRGGLTIT